MAEKKSQALRSDPKDRVSKDEGGHSVFAAILRGVRYAASSETLVF
jgi:hypothetical protein